MTLDTAPCVIHSFVDVTYRRFTGRQSLDLDDGTTMKAAGHHDEGARKVATCITSQPTSLTAALIRGVSPHPVPPTIPLVPRVRKVTGQGSLRSRNVRDSRCLPGGGDFKPSASFYCLQSAARGGSVTCKDRCRQPLFLCCCCCCCMHDAVVVCYLPAVRD